MPFHFQVRKKMQGDIARAQFYFSIMYNKPIPNDVEKVLRAWHKADPVSKGEKARNHNDMYE